MKTGRNLILERIEQAGYHAGRTANSTIYPVYRGPGWTDEQRQAYRHEFMQGMAYAVIKGECRIRPGGLIISVEHARDILGLDETE